MPFNFSSVYFLDKNKTKHTISTIYRSKKGEGTTTVWSSGGATPDNYFTFTLLEDDTYSIKAKSVANMPTEVVLPATYNGKPVTVIEEQAFCSINMTNYTVTGANFKTITIPSSITTIGMAAFYQCKNLSTVIFSEGSQLTTIDDNAFEGTNITYFVIPNGVTFIGNYAFGGCSNLRGIFIPSSVTTDYGISTNSDNVIIYCEAENQPSGWDDMWNTDNRPVYWGCSLGDDVDYLTYTELEDGTYSVKAKDVNNIPSTVEIPLFYNGKPVTVIEDNAFENCETITTVSIPPSITSIGEDAFNNCNSLAEVNIPNSVTTIEDYAFRYCSALPTIIIPSSVTTMGFYIFSNCKALSIKCEATEKPSGWDDMWNIDNRPVTWGYTG